MKKLLLAGIIVAAFTFVCGAARAQDVAKVSPATNKVLVENAYVRVLQATFAPGAKEGLHTHPASFYYVTMPGKLKVSYADGTVEMWEPPLGESSWMDGEKPHTAENVGTTTLQYIMIEVKGAPTAFPNSK